MAKRVLSRGRLAVWTALCAILLVVPALLGQAAPGTVSATVVDADGASIAAAKVALTSEGSTTAKIAVTDKEGWFSFSGVPAGKFKLEIVASGFATTQLAGTIEPGADDMLPDVALRVANASSDVQVSLSRIELAEVDVKEEETQHVLFLLPNFFMTYNWHALPLTTKQKYELAFKSTIDPGGNILFAATAGIYQAFNVLPGFGGGPQGYFKRLGAVIADGNIGLYVGSAILPSLLHQDPRYFYMGPERGRIKARAWYAIKSAFICRSDKGTKQFNYSGVIGDVAAGAASNLYYPAGSRNGATLTIENGLLSVAGDAGSNLAQEFVVRWFTPHAPKPQP